MIYVPASDVAGAMQKSTPLNMRKAGRPAPL